MRTNSPIQLRRFVWMIYAAVNNSLNSTGVTGPIGNGNNLFAGTLSGAFRSTNNGTSWTAVNPRLTTTLINTRRVVGYRLSVAGDVWLVAVPVHRDFPFMNTQTAEE